ncbi:MAG: DUF1836 domain-containing protein [Clostridia bacterium]|nr:DUF1836 domain-containing protein [Clostridia bacterium]
MSYDKALIAGKLRRWETYLKNYRLPYWEDLPNLGLYMEQVVSLLKRYLDYMPPELQEEEVVTAAAINNYVRKKIMPEPVKKKYFRIHIAYLIMICTLKQSLSIPTLQALLPMGLPEKQVQARYDAYVRRHHAAAEFFTQQVRLAAGGILGHDAASDFSTDDPVELITSSAVIGGFSRLLAQKLLLLEGKTLETGGSIEIRTPKNQPEHNA